MWPAPLSCSEAARIESSPSKGLIPWGLYLTDHLANEIKMKPFCFSLSYFLHNYLAEAAILLSWLCATVQGDVQKKMTVCT